MWIKQPDSICRLGLGTLRTETLITGGTPCVPPLVKGDALLVFFLYHSSNAQNLFSGKQLCQLLMTSGSHSNITR